MSRNYVWVDLSDIEYVDRSELKQNRLDILLNGYHSFDDVLNNESDKSDPIKLDGARKPYSITDGRHRIYLARQKGYTRVKAIF
ncbi:MAG: hypothetical protein U7127_22430 [Phormidium sp.]